MSGTYNVDIELTKPIKFVKLNKNQKVIFNMTKKNSLRINLNSYYKIKKKEKEEEKEEIQEEEEIQEHKNVDSKAKILWNKLKVKGGIQTQINSNFFTAMHLMHKLKNLKKNVNENNELIKPEEKNINKIQNLVFFKGIDFIFNEEEINENQNEVEYDVFTSIKRLLVQNEIQKYSGNESEKMFGKKEEEMLYHYISYIDVINGLTKFEDCQFMSFQDLLNKEENQNKQKKLEQFMIRSKFQIEFKNCQFDTKKESNLSGILSFNNNLIISNSKFIELKNTVIAQTNTNSVIKFQGNLFTFSKNQSIIIEGPSKYIIISHNQVYI